MNNRVKYYYLFLDAIASMIVWIIMIVYRKTLAYGEFFKDIFFYIPNFNYSTTLVLFPLGCIFLYYLSGFYLRPVFHTFGKIVLTTLLSSAIISFCTFFLLLLDDVVISYLDYYYSLLLLFGLLFFITLFFRLIVFYIARYNYSKRIWVKPTLIIGTGKLAEKYAREIQKNKVHNTFVGFVSYSFGKRSKPTDNNHVLGDFSAMNKIVKKYHIEEAIIAIENLDDHTLFTIINSLYTYNIDIKYPPRINEILTGSVKMETLSIGPLVNITSSSMSDWETCVKRFFDIFLSTISLIILLPLNVFFMIAIKIDSEGPVFYRQERIGRHGRPFNIIKFRTMCVNSESRRPRLSNPNDERITKVGRILRKYRFDEIPQFWNIIKGEMSIVGPRPERAYYIKKISEIAPYYCLVYKIRPGLTSWGPIRIGYTDTVEKMVERLNYDIIYIDNMSLKTDVKILLYTIEVIFKGKGI